MKPLLAAAVALAAVFTAACAAPAVRADDPKAAPKAVPFAGAWTRLTEAGVRITLTFKKKDEFTLTAEVGDGKLTLACKSEFDAKTGVVKGEVTKVDGKGEFPQVPEKGYKLGFKLAAGKGKAKTVDLTEYDADNADQVRDILEGEYKARKDD